MSVVRAESGSVSLELALVTPVFMLLVLGLLQFGLWYHAHHVVQAAAREGVRVAASEGGSEAPAESRASDIVDSGLGRMAVGTQAEAAIGIDRASVTVATTVGGLLPIPGLHQFRIEATASSYRERFRPAGEGP